MNNKIFSKNVVKSIMNNLESNNWKVREKENYIAFSYFTNEDFLSEFHLLDIYNHKDEILHKIFFEYALNNNFQIVKDNIILEDDDSITYISEIKKDDAVIRYRYYYNLDTNDCNFTFEMI